MSSTYRAKKNSIEMFSDECILYEWFSAKVRTFCPDTFVDIL